jgi:hypothetical protein
MATPVRHPRAAAALPQHSVVATSVRDDQETHCRVLDTASDNHLSLVVEVQFVVLDAAAAFSAPHYHQKALHILTITYRSRLSTRRVQPLVLHILTKNLYNRWLTWNFPQPSAYFPRVEHSPN